MNEERLSGLGKLFIYGGTDYGIPEPEVIYQLKLLHSFQNFLKKYFFRPRFIAPPPPRQKFLATALTHLKGFSM